MNIKSRPASEDSDTKAWDLGTITTNPKVAYSLQPCITLPKDGKQGFAPPYWFVPEAKDGQKGNMRIHLEAIHVLTPTERVEVHVPVLKNSVKLKIGDELLVCSQQPQPPRKKARVQASA
eukprot:8546030-Pyramimonas_sp.AAC.1